MKDFPLTTELSKDITNNPKNRDQLRQMLVDSANGLEKTYKIYINGFLVDYRPLVRQ